MPDRAIPVVAIQVASGGALRRGAVVAHCSGALPAGVLAGVRAGGGWPGSIHPLQTFADVETAIASLPGSFYFLEGDTEAVDVLRSVVLSIDGRPVPLDSAQKSLYHAAACAASNFLVTLVDYAASLMMKAGVPPDVAMPALLPLVHGTVRNLETVGLPDALTGPISRGDIGTVKGHLAALRRAPGRPRPPLRGARPQDRGSCHAQGKDRARHGGPLPRPLPRGRGGARGLAPADAVATSPGRAAATRGRAESGRLGGESPATHGREMST